MDRKRLIRSTWILRGVVGLLLMGGLWLLYGRPLKPRGVQPGSQDQEAIKFGSYYLYGYGEAGNRKTLQWTLTAIDATLSPDGHTYKSQSIRDGTFYQGGVVTARFTAGPATCNPTTKDLDLGGPIQIDAVNGVHVHGGALRYTSSTRRLSADGPIQVSNEKTHFAAGHLDADLALNDLICYATPGQPVSLMTKLDPVGRL